MEAMKEICSSEKVPEVAIMKYIEMTNRIELLNLQWSSFLYSLSLPTLYLYYLSSLIHLSLSDCFPSCLSNLSISTLTRLAFCLSPFYESLKYLPVSTLKLSETPLIPTYNYETLPG
jgi:hypothetical protein